MNLAETIAHGQAWVEAGWVWAPGQVFIAIGPPHPGRPLDLGVSRVWCGRVATAPGAPEREGWEAVPDLRDPGARGHAFAQVQEAWPSDYEWTLHSDGSVGYEHPGKFSGEDCMLGGGFDTLLAARLAAP